MDIILRPKSKGKVFCLLASVSFLVLAKISKLPEKTKFLQIYFFTNAQKEAFYQHFNKPLTDSKIIRSSLLYNKFVTL